MYFEWHYVSYYNLKKIILAYATIDSVQSYAQYSH